MSYLPVPTLRRIGGPFDASRAKTLADDVADCLTAVDPEPVLALKTGAKRVQRGDLRWGEFEMDVRGVGHLNPLYSQPFA